MPPVFIPGGRIFVEGPTHGFSGWPGGQTVFGRVRGSDYSHWDGITGMAMRCLGAEPGYNGCFCPADSFLLCVQTFQPTWVLGVTVGGTGCCAPCGVYSGGCGCPNCQSGGCPDCYDGNPLHPRPVCAPCDALCGGSGGNDGGVAGNIHPFPLSGVLGFNEMEALGFTVHDWDSQANVSGNWSGNTFGPFTGPDGVTFPSNAGGAGSSRLSNVAGGFWWMNAYYDSSDGSVLYIMVMGGCYPIVTLGVPGWSMEMVTDGIGGLIQVFSFGPIIPPPALPKIAFGHAVNCNNYPPIDWGSGSFSAPGNGLLIGDPMKGVIPS
jgi:hypothetical protein